MRVFRKWITVLLVCVLLLSVCSVGALAAWGMVDVDRECTLGIELKDGGVGIPGMEFTIYQVGTLDSLGKVTLAEDFADYPVETEDLDQEGWLKLAATLESFVLQDGNSPVEGVVTDENGEAMFPNDVEKLVPGLYLILGGRVVVGEWEYTAKPFLAMLGVQGEYDQIAEPKYDRIPYTPGPVPMTLKVLKSWQDQGYESVRLDHVTVQLLCDGELYEEVILNADNQWRHTWNGLDRSRRWNVAELLPAGSPYNVKIELEGITYIITNTYRAPKTSVVPPVQKRITGETPATASKFTFVLAAQGQYPMPDGKVGGEKEINIIGAGSADFGNIVFDTPGEYTYTISEKNSAVKGYTYDTTVYTLRYEVTLVNGEYVVSSGIYGPDGTKVTDVVFSNKYVPGGNIPQTGVLWWPVPVLLLLGMVFITLGDIKRKRYQR